LQKLGTRLFFDKRENSSIGKQRALKTFFTSAPFLDVLTVNETANEPPPEDGTMDSAKSLGMEAVFINHNFAQQVLKMVSPLVLPPSDISTPGVCLSV
jgi:translation initiation factor 3 subunit D